MSQPSTPPAPSTPQPTGGKPMPLDDPNKDGGKPMPLEEPKPTT
jgi:hypothetical protein